MSESRFKDTGQKIDDFQYISDVLTECPDCLNGAKAIRGLYIHGA
ncbi:hypothetical protein [Paenibacillus radicis (ex Xue et al. 2023)]|nr:hypothetical protein [Paenibacillus radicis (ex Xue et al. 2023)]